MKIRPIYTFLAALLMLGLSHALANEPITLPTGNKIEILDIGQVNFPTAPPALMLKYQTSLNLDDKNALRGEVDLMWARFIQDVEKANLTSAVISANEVPKGTIISQNRSYNYVLKKVDGKWCIEPPSKSETPPTHLTEAAINELLQRWDATSQYLNVEAALLYLTPDWSDTVTGVGPDGKPQATTLDWKKLAAAGRQMVAALADYKYARENTRIQIAPDGQSATVSSKITEKMTGKNGKAVATVSESVDHIQLIDGQPLCKASEQKLIEMK